MAFSFSFDLIGLPERVRPRPVPFAESGRTIYQIWPEESISKGHRSTAPPVPGDLPPETFPPSIDRKKSGNEAEKGFSLTGRDHARQVPFFGIL